MSDQTALIESFPPIADVHNSKRHSDGGMFAINFRQLRTRREKAAMASHLAAISNTKDTILYESHRHQPGPYPKFSPTIGRRQTKLTKQPSSLTKRRYVKQFRKLCAFHEFITRNQGIEAPRDSWENWIDNHKWPGSHDKAFMCLLVILMS